MVKRSNNDMPATAGEQNDDADEPDTAGKRIKTELLPTVAADTSNDSSEVAVKASKSSWPANGNDAGRNASERRSDSVDRRLKEVSAF